MKAVLRSVKPYWFYLICEGIKKIEVGKTAPQSDEWDSTVYLYCSKDMRSFSRIPEQHREKYKNYLGTVGAKFVCYEIEDILYLLESDLVMTFLPKYTSPAGSCLTSEELLQYGKGKPLYGWHITEPKLYDKPRELAEFSRYGYKEIEHAGSGYIFCGNTQCEYCEPAEVIAGLYKPPVCIKDGCRITRPPQSWCYVGEF